ncbi:MAG: tRNA-(ms[2]io[6]A)-hydroxylase [Gammaproteobacteria bacterium]|nr:MAG: tRNA-(ms[2]io[6]A)-hydroxylase [Gammaproteobacteria bacterium]
MQDLALEPTPSGWLDAVFADFDAFLNDHASCEKKASGMALNIAAHYPDQPALVAAMVDLAVEELGHYREVIRLLIQRGITPGPDRKDAYIRALNDEIRRGPEFYLLDRLLVAAIVERRGNERFGLIAERLPSAEFSGAAALAAFYRGITASEDRHWQLFLDLAASHCPTLPIDARLSELVATERRLMLAQPLEPTLH